MTKQCYGAKLLSLRSQKVLEDGKFHHDLWRERRISSRPSETRIRRRRPARTCVSTIKWHFPPTLNIQNSDLALATNILIEMPPGVATSRSGCANLLQNALP